MRRRNVFLLYEIQGRMPDYASKRVVGKHLEIGLEKRCKSQIKIKSLRILMKNTQKFGRYYFGL